MDDLIEALFGGRQAAVVLAARTFWTFVQAFLGVLTATALLNLDVTVLQTAGASGLSAAFAAVSAFARQRLSSRPPA